MADSVVRDARGSVVEHRTAGYHSKDNTAPASNGLIEVFVYDYRGYYPAATAGQWTQTDTFSRVSVLSPPDLPVVPQLVAKGFKFGDQATTWYMTEFHDFHPNNPELVIKDIEFSKPIAVSGQTPLAARNAVPAATALAPDDVVRNYVYDFYAATTSGAQGASTGSSTIAAEFGQPAASSGTLPFPDVARVKTRTTVHSEIASTGTTNEELIEVEHFDNAGRSSIVGRGYRPVGSTSPSRFNARLRLVTGGGQPVYSGSLAQWPGNTSAATTLISGTAVKVRKDRDGRPLRVDGPDGRLTLFLYRKDDTDPNRTIRVTYHGVDPIGLSTKEPVTVEYVRGTNVEIEQGRLLSTAVPVSIAALNVSGSATMVGDVVPGTGTMTDPAGLGGTGVESATIVYEKRAVRDPAGRLSGLQLVDPANPTVPLAFGIEYDGFGKISRVRSATGSITRNVYDNLGRQTRTFRGTADLHEVWGSAMDTTSTTGACGAHYDQDNMVMVSGQDYGWGINDAGLPTTTRSPRAMAVNQYELDGSCGVPASTIGTIGLVDRTRYDTRMRPVWREKAPNVTGAATRVEVTWLDAQDRPYLEAVFTASYAATLGTYDPRTCSPTLVVTAANVLSKHPLSLTETVYDAQGRAMETRDYDVAAITTPRYTSVRTWYDHDDRAIRVQTPTGTTDTVYDAKGRVESVTDLAGTLEISKTTNTYDNTNDTLIEVTTLSRVANSTSGALQDGVNAVRKRTFYWYDSRKNRITTVEMGTENASDVYVSGGSPVARPATLDSNYTYDGNGRLTGVSLAGLTGGMARCWEYDYANRVIGEVASDGRVTRTSYDAFGRITRVDENALGSDPVRRTTEYRYDAQSRLSLIAAGNKYFAPGTAWESNGDALTRVTKMEYGAPVVTETYQAIRGASSTTAGVPLTDPDKVWRVYLPEPATGRPGTTASLEFSYLLTGEVAQRKDLRRNVAIGFTYDDRGNMTSWKADLSGMSTPPGGLAIDQVEEVSYTYDALDRLVDALAIAHQSQQVNDFIADTAFAYDGRGNLQSESQSHGKLVDFDAPAIVYGRDYVAASGGASGRDRLVSITYPYRNMKDSTDPYVLGIGYGATGSIDDQLSCVASLGEVGATRRLADFTSDGSGLRVATYRGVLASSGVPTAQEQAWSDSFLTGGGVGTDRLDRFGRIRTARADKVASGGTLSILWQTLTAYDAGGRRAYERISTGTTTATDNANSWLYGYDGLDRLTGAYRGKLTSTNGALETTSARRLVDWRLDPLGSWTGDSSSSIAGRRTTVINASGTTTATLEETDAVNGQEGITQRTRKANTGTPVAALFASDASGNLQFDGRYVYQYDALGRLVQVNEKGGCTVNTSGQLTGTPGPWVEHRTYDGLGRVIRVQAPWPIPGASGGYVVSRRFYYDGDRRIARVSTLPYSPTQGNVGDPGRIKFDPP